MNRRPAALLRVSWHRWRPVGLWLSRLPLLSSRYGSAVRWSSLNAPGRTWKCSRSSQQAYG